jgi:tRNA(fMet)-specific endonuclease VapC
VTIYVFDTNAVIALMNDEPQSVRTRLRRVTSSGAIAVVSAIAVFELWYGVARSQRQEENRQRLRSFLSGGMQVLPFEAEDAEVAGELRQKLAKPGKPIGPYDLLMAAQVLRLGATLITANTREFARVPGLHWQDWTSRSS